MKKIIFPGSFDPVTNGHLNIIERLARQADEVLVAVAEDNAKQSLWTLAERVAFLEASVSHIPQVRVLAFSGLLVDFLKQEDAHLLVKGIRSVVDWAYESQMAAVNARLYPGLETMYLAAQDEISSSVVRELWRLGADISPFVPKEALVLMSK